MQDSCPSLGCYHSSFVLPPLNRSNFGSLTWSITIFIAVWSRSSCIGTHRESCAAQSSSMTVTREILGRQYQREITRPRSSRLQRRSLSGVPIMDRPGTMSGRLGSDLEIIGGRLASDDFEKPGGRLHWRTEIT